MNFHTDEWIMNKLREHYKEALEYFPEDRIVGIFLQGSQNYGLDVEGSDIDTKLIVVPSFEEIAMNMKPISTTHIRANSEHIDFKDVRLYMQTFRKQNINFLEILFTSYAIVNPRYKEPWDRLVRNREAIAHFNPYRNVQAMKGMALEKYHALEHFYPNKATVLEKYGYDPKQLHHMARLDDFLTRYIAGEPYVSCLIPKHIDYLRRVKAGMYTKDEAEQVAEHLMEHLLQITSSFYETYENKADPKVDQLLDEVQLEIMRIAIQEELRKRN